MMVLGGLWGLLTFQMLSSTFIRSFITNACVLPHLVSRSRSNPYTENGPQFLQVSISIQIVTRRFKLYYVRRYFSVLTPLETF